MLHLSRRPVERATTQHMHVEMKNRLPGACAGINHRAVTILPKSLVICDTRSDAQQVAQQCFVLLCSVVERLEMFSGNYEYVSWRLRIDVANHDRAIVLMQKVTWYLT
jgi:hypothetical protein